MAAMGTLRVCAEFCAAHAYMGLQWTDQCFCDNAYGVYGQLDDADCGWRGDACGQNITQTGTCAMMNAVFRLPAPWTCADHLRESLCIPGTTTRRHATHVSTLGLTAAEAQTACCDVTCAV